MNSPPEDVELLGSTKPGRFELQIAKYWQAFHGLVFLTSGLYVAYLLVRHASGRDSVLLMFGVAFLLRAALAVSDSIHRARALEERLQDPDLKAGASLEHEFGSWSNAIFVIGDLVILTSVGSMAYAILVAKSSSGVSGVPLFLGISVGLLFYLIAIPVRIAGK